MCLCIFLLFPLKTSFLVYTKPLFFLVLVEALAFSELKTPLVCTFFFPSTFLVQKRGPDTRSKAPSGPILWGWLPPKLTIIVNPWLPQWPQKILETWFEVLEPSFQVKLVTKSLKIVTKSPKMVTNFLKIVTNFLKRLSRIVLFRRLFVTCCVFTRYFFVALFCLEKQCSGLLRYFFVVFSWLFRGFFVAPVLGKFYAYSPWKSLLSYGILTISTLGPLLGYQGPVMWWPLALDGAKGLGVHCSATMPLFSGTLRKSVAITLSQGQCCVTPPPPCDKNMITRTIPQQLFFVILWGFDSCDTKIPGKEGLSPGITRAIRYLF